MGRERSPEWYDAALERSVHLRLPYHESPYYPMWQKIAKWLEPSGVQTVMDLGCGPGQFAQVIENETHCHYFGVDFSQDRIDAARRAVPHFLFVRDDVFEPRLHGMSYDTVVCLELLEHLDNDVELLGLIRKGTRVFASVPNFGGESHVRHFSTHFAVCARYQSQFSKLMVDTFEIAPGRLVFLMDGIKN